MSRRAILLSGGIDSAALAYWKTPELAITIDYGQKPAAGEIRAASKIAELLGIEHRTITIDCSSIGSGDLAGTNPIDEAPASEWWPFRNQLLATLAASFCVSKNINELIVGSIASDSFHADGTKEFYENLHRLVSTQEGRLSISAPAIEMSAEQLLAVSQIPRSFLGWTHSCHKSDFACGNCRGCYKHFNIMRNIS